MLLFVDSQVYDILSPNQYHKAWHNISLNVSIVGLGELL